MALIAAACRGDPDLFQADDRDPSGTRLTFSPGDDRSPTWSRGGDSIYYSAAELSGTAGGDGVLVSLAVGGGSARTLLTNVQSPEIPSARWLTAPAVSPAADRLAFVEILAPWWPHPCSLERTVLSCTPQRDEAQVRLPPLRQVALRVRAFHAMGTLDDDPAVIVHTPGVTEESSDGVLVAVARNYPFQQAFATERAFAFRVSWSPDGGRVVSSDGLRLLTWSPGEEVLDTIPGTLGGVMPAWSPDGAWIAFSRLQPIDSIAIACRYDGAFGTSCRQERIDYVAAAPELARIQPDGGGLMTLGVGDEAAWAADGSALYFRRDGRIWRSEADGSNAEPIPGAEGGREPAPSPDGQLLAFARRAPRGDHDIWVIALPH